MNRKFISQHFIAIFSLLENHLQVLFCRTIIICIFFFQFLTNIGAQQYWGPSGGYILNTTTNFTYSSLTAAHDAAATLDGHTLKFMPANLNIYSTAVFDTDHNPTNVTKAITIDGNGAKITNDNGSSNTSRALWLSPAINRTITIENMTLCSFSNTTGAAILSNPSTSGGKIIMNYVNVYGSYNSGWGVQLEHNADISYCNIGNPNGTNTGGLKILASNLPTAITINISNSTFNCNNQPAVPGAGLWLSSVATHRANTVTITGCTFNGNDVGGSYGAAIANDFTSGSTLVVTISTFIGNTGSNTSGAAAYYGSASGGSASFTGCNFINNDRNALWGGNSTHYIYVDGCKFINNPNGTTRVRASGYIRNSLLHQTLLNTTDGSVYTNNVTTGTTSTFDNTLGTYYVPGYGAVNCNGGCQNSTVASGAQLTLPPCLTPGTTLTSTQSGNWFYQKSGAAAVQFATSSMTATIPANLTPGYYTFWQDVSSGTDPVFAGDVQSYAIGTNTNTTPANAACMGSLSGNVFQDGTTSSGSANGLNDESLPISGVTVELLNSMGNVIATTTTNASGNYNFYNIPEGTFSIRITLPSGYYGSTYNNASGSNSSNDSDITQGTGSTYTISGISINLLNQATNGNDAFTGSSDYTNIGAGFVLVAQALPVTWSSLYVDQKDCENTLRWTTESETNNDYFVVETSRDAARFESLGMVDGNGDSRQQRAYGYKHKVTGGTLYYRVKQVDHDGRVSYSDVIKATGTGCREANLIAVYPNPTGADLINVEIRSGTIREEVTVTVINQVGQVVWQGTKTMDDNPVIKMDISSLNPGVYVVSATSTDGSSIGSAVRFVKLR